MTKILAAELGANADIPGNFEPRRGHIERIALKIEANLGDTTERICHHAQVEVGSEAAIRNLDERSAGLGLGARWIDGRAAVTSASHAGPASGGGQRF